MNRRRHETWPVAATKKDFENFIAGAEGFSGQYSGNPNVHIGTSVKKFTEKKLYGKVFFLLQNVTGGNGFWVPKICFTPNEIFERVWGL